VSETDILSRGELAWNSSLNTINVGKFELGCASIGICTHAFYEALNHAAGRNLYGRAVTDFPHVRRLFAEAYARLTAMKLFACGPPITCGRRATTIAAISSSTRWSR